MWAQINVSIVENKKKQFSNRSLENTTVFREFLFQNSHKPIN